MPRPLPGCHHAVERPLPDVETVCDHVIVLGRGQLLAQGRIQDMKQVHHRFFEVRLKECSERFAQHLRTLGCSAEPRDDMLLVQIPAEQTQALLWQTAHATGAQIRYLRPQRGTLEEVFLKAVSEV